MEQLDSALNREVDPDLADFFSLEPAGDDNKKKGPWYKRLWKKKEGERKPEVGVLEFFGTLKGYLEYTDLTTYQVGVSEYLREVKSALEMGQTALAERLKESMEVRKLEILLGASGFGKYVTESQVVNLTRKSEKGLCLDYVGDFGRPIPAEVREIKLQADRLCAFDNYAVLHYDPSGKGRVLSPAEEAKERKKKSDPILFGLIRGSRKLYYVADWIDEYCDLTLEEFLRITAPSGDPGKP